MTVKCPSQGTDFHLCSWYRWPGWWNWSETPVQYHTHSIIPGWLHHLITWNGNAVADVTRGSPVQLEVVAIIKTKGRMFTSSYEEETAAIESALTWKSTDPTMLQLPFSFSKTVNHYVKLSYHQILVPLQFTIPLSHSPLPFSFNGSLAILPFCLLRLQTTQEQKRWHAACQVMQTLMPNQMKSLWLTCKNTHTHIFFQTGFWTFRYWEKR